MKNPTISTTDRPSAWPRALIGFFAAFISFLIALIAFATRQKMDLVRDDYYEEEVRFQRQFDRLVRSQPVRAAVSIRYDPNLRAITIALPVAQAVPRATGRIRLYRPSDARLDRDIQLALTADGTQRLDTANLRSGLWRVHVYWKINGAEYYFDQPIVVGSSAS